MENEILLDETSVRMIDILEQIKKLNHLVDLHKQTEGNNLMVVQYEELKNRFLAELAVLLEDYQIKADLHILAA